MNPGPAAPRSCWTPVVAICGALFVGALWAAPRSCEGGLDAYVYGGLVAVVLLGSIPFWRDRTRSTGSRLARGAGYATLGIASWVAWLFVANVRITCRLFQRARMRGGQ